MWEDPSSDLTPHEISWCAKVFLRKDDFLGATNESQEICATITMVKKKKKPLIHLAQTLIASNLFVRASSESRQSII